MSSDHPSPLSHSFSIQSQRLPVYQSHLGHVEYYVDPVEQCDPRVHHQLATYETLEEHRNPYAYYAPYGYPTPAQYYPPENGPGFGSTVTAPVGHAYLNGSTGVPSPVYSHHVQHQTCGLPLAPESWRGPMDHGGQQDTGEGHTGSVGTRGMETEEGQDQHGEFDWGVMSGVSMGYHSGSDHNSGPITKEQYGQAPVDPTDHVDSSPKPSSTRMARSKGKKDCGKGQGEPTHKFQCLLCAKQYCRRSTLKTHLRHHSGERPYYCSVCGKSFAQAANLTAHRRIHTGEKPFACPICCRPFSQSSSLVTHKRTHTGEKPYQCPRCDKAFTDSSTLTKHIRTHTGVKPYTCGICLLSFSQSGNLNRHMKTHLKQQGQ